MCSSISASKYKKSKRQSSTIVSNVAVYMMPNSSGIFMNQRKRTKYCKKQLKRELTPIDHSKHNSKLLDVNEIAAERYLMTQS